MRHQRNTIFAPQQKWLDPTQSIDLFFNQVI
jgi:hypothetical protein